LIFLQDWFTPIDPATPLPPLADASSKAADQTAATPERALEELKHELDLQIRELMRVMKTGGEVYYRSAGKKPWYNQRCGCVRSVYLHCSGPTASPRPPSAQVHARRVRRRGHRHP
jgi:hypothetical protein